MAFKSKYLSVIGKRLKCTGDDASSNEQSYLVASTLLDRYFYGDISLDSAQTMQKKNFHTSDLNVDRSYWFPGSAFIVVYKRRVFSASKQYFSALGKLVPCKNEFKFKYILMHSPEIIYRVILINKFYQRKQQKKCFCYVCFYM